MNASDSPETNPISGVPKTLVTFTKEPTLNLVVVPLEVSKSLALSISTYVVPIFAISYPLTYALPCERPSATFASLASLLSVENVPAAYTPRLSPDTKCSLTSKSKFLTV